MYFSYGNGALSHDPFEDVDEDVEDEAEDGGVELVESGEEDLDDLESEI